MQTVFKYPFGQDQLVEHGTEVVFTMPAEAEVLTVQPQGDTAVLWALVNTDNTPVERRFMTVFTGHELPAGFAGRYVSTFQSAEGSAVWHIFELGL